MEEARIAMLCPCIYYGPVDRETLKRLEGFDLLVLAPTLDPSIVSRLSRGRTTLGYISIATIGGWEPWAGLVPRSIVVGENREWGELIVDACSPEWRRVFTWALRWVSSRGYTGFMLDNLDVADEYPRMKRCIAGLVALARRLYPRAKIMVNRGFSLLDETAPLIDYLLFEDFPSYYDASRREYRVYTGRDLAWLVSTLKRAETLSHRYGFEIILLAYGDPSDARLVSRICGIVEEYDGGHPLYLAPWSLQSIGVCNPCGRRTSSTRRGGGAAAAEKGARGAWLPVWLAAALALGAAGAAYAVYESRRRRGL